jgi:uncharacterized membrane protein
MANSKEKKTIAKTAKPVAGTASKPASETNNETICAVLSYFLIGIVWYFADDNMKKSSFAKFHAKQALVLLIAWIIVWVVGMFIFWIPFIGWLIGFVLGLFFLVAWILGIVYAATGKEKTLPIIGSFAEKISF